MKTLTTYIEQLDRAAEELRGGTDVGNRLALILVDNVVELMLHRWCESRFKSANAFSLNQKDPRYNGLAKARVLGTRFDEKLKFVKAEDQLSEVEANFIGLCHKYRNEAYHLGLSRENVLLPVSWLYHQLTCELFLRLDTKMRAHDAEIIVPERVAKHAPPSWSEGKRHIDLFDTAPIAASLNAARPELSRLPGESYADALDEWIAHLERVTNYTVSGFGKPVERVLAEAQWWKDLFTNIPPHIEHGEPLSQHLSEKHSKMSAEWRPKYDAIPIPGWRKRTQRMRQEKDGRKALGSYDRLYDEIAFYDSFMMDAAGVIDQQVEEAVERSKEERNTSRQMSAHLR
ncbi:hypothetical protein QCE62_09630 [Caballeronia sp. LZ033]|uniref:hypothetical protein n=1 Tax=Caballeronia sp. LZ033 TaxID=3038566 RepID=UPI0028671E0B|nr:hypothetical protein [Caballeronia sp. LZ033]MDR5813845.1 hypothetical protein [Caballeronia sp. LZ033]